MSKLRSAIFIRVIFLGIVAVFLIIKTRKTKKIKEKLKRFTFKDFDLFFTKFMAYQFDTNYIGLQNTSDKELYFVNHKNKINMEFELIRKEQIPFYNRLIAFAKEKGYKTKQITYQHKTDFNPDKYAPVLQILSNLTTNQAIEVSKEVFKTVFNCNEYSTFVMLE